MTRLFVILLTLLMVSCSNEEYDVVDNTSSTQEAEMENFDFLIGKFSLSLAKVFSENEDVRELIKEEALKQFDCDYDVLYLLVNDKPLAGGRTLEKLLLQYLTVEEISSLIHKMPTLTIYVPSLPEDTFSAESWNVQQDIPFVAYKNEKNQILYVDHKGTVDMIQYDEIPVFPIVVIKPSDRVSLYSTNVRSATTPTILRAGNGMNFVFEYEDFNNKSRINTRATPIPDNYKKIYDAKKKSDENGIWQRDYIYYNISTKDGTGVFQKNMSECLYSFELLGDPNAIYRVIADQDDDPKHRPEGQGRHPVRGQDWGTEKYWYAGNFEFIVKIYVSSTQLTSNEIIKAISINPTDLFELELQKQGSGRNSNPMRVVGMKKIKKYYLPQPLPLFDWNIENYSASIKVSIEERDDKYTEQNTIETSSTFATNFEFNASLGEKNKVGAKFGASSSITQKVATTITRYLDSDPLGDVVINFGDDVVVKNVMDSIGRRAISDRPSRPSRSSSNRVLKYEPIYAPAFNPKYNSGYYRIEVAPLAQY